MCIRDRVSTQSTGSVAGMVRAVLVLVVLAVAAGDAVASGVQLGAGARSTAQPEEAIDVDDPLLDQSSPRVQLAICRSKREKQSLKLKVFHAKGVTCHKKLNEIKQETVRVSTRAEEEEPGLRAKSVEETRVAREGVTKANEVATKERKLRLEAEAECAKRIDTISQNRKVSAANKEAQGASSDSEFSLKESQIRLHGEHEKAALTLKMTKERETAVTAVQKERDEAVQAAQADAEQAIKSMLDSLDSEEARLKAEQALGFEQKKIELDAKVKQAAVQRDTVVKNAQHERDQTLAEAAELKSQLETVQSSTQAAADARTKAEFELVQFKKEMGTKLLEAKAALEAATKAATDAAKAVYDRGSKKQL
eukprot:TRINITY_DN816_c0_g1_i1.p1 TRINITY_DN816_c0_g1~~TRINITY_DN816_c0_g1_i1.p1  ORF type:complete len:366 (-),score=121.66 TRINITY_DN816_c0_g1_i1:388-1485(-)